MEGIFTVVVMAILISGLIFGFVNQLICMLTIKSSKAVIQRYRRTLIGHYLTTAMFAGF